jgi:hypothetical protein
VAEVDEHAGHEHAEAVEDYYPENSMLGDVFEGDYAGDCGFGNCGRCRNCCGTLCNPGGCGMYVRADYLLWSTRGWHPTLDYRRSHKTHAGVINGAAACRATRKFVRQRPHQRQGRPAADCARHLPSLLDPGRDYYGLTDKRTGLRRSTGGTFLGIPFWEIQQRRHIHGCPEPATAGSISVGTVPAFKGRGAVLRNLCCWEGAALWWDGCPSMSPNDRLSAGISLRRLDDVPTIRESATAGRPDRPDVFDTKPVYGSDIRQLQFRRRC